MDNTPLYLYYMMNNGSNDLFYIDNNFHDGISGCWFSIINAYPVRAGYIFQGWKLRSGEIYQSGDALFVSGDCYLQAVWEKEVNAPIAEFTWTDDDENNIKEGKPPNCIGATAWNRFNMKMNEVSQRQGKGPINYTEAYWGLRIGASLFNELLMNLVSLDGCGAVPAMRHKGESIKAKFFIDLKTALNNAITYSNNNN